MDLAQTFARLARHTYVRTPVTSTVGDETTYYTEQETPATADAPRACLYVPYGSLIITVAGVVRSERDELHVLAADPLAPGELVSQITDAAGRVLRAGPVRVTEVVDMASSGAVTRRIATLVSAEAQ